jgi:peroxiredoxin
VIKHFCPVILSLAVLALGIPSDSFANLSVRLRETNFNLYASPSPANEMRLSDIQGGPLNLARYRGKVVILNFWKIDCQPCSAEKVILEKVYRKYGGRGLAIVAVNLFDTPERIRTYCNRGGFSFPFAIDPDKRFRVQQHEVRAGSPTAFVVNTGNEAIYEIPALPTTYVINKRGQVVGNALGLVNWEEQPFTELLESLLGEPSHAPAIARNGDDFAQAAREGPRQRGPRQQEDTAQETTQFQSASNASETPPPTRVAQAPSLPFQPHQEAVPTAAPQPETAIAPGTATGPREGVRAPTPGATHVPQAQTRKKPKQAHARPTAAPLPAGQPQPYAPPAAAGAVAQESPIAGNPTQRPGTAAAPAAPPAAQPVPVGPPRAAGTLAPLPPAMPYSPPGNRIPTAAPPVNPDDEGNVMARIPGQTGAPDAGRFVKPSGPGSLPQAQRIGGSNPLGGFIMDAFGQPRPPGAQGTPERMPPPEPPSSVLGQLNRDISALGSGIKDAFSRILPTR